MHFLHAFTDDIIEKTNQEMSRHFDEIRLSIVGLKAELPTLTMFKCTKLILEIGKELQCIICKYVIEPPAVFANCCGKIIGCEKCITQLLQQGKLVHIAEVMLLMEYILYVDWNSLVNLKKKFTKMTEYRLYKLQTMSTMQISGTMFPWVL